MGTENWPTTLCALAAAFVYISTWFAALNNVKHFRENQIVFLEYELLKMVVKIMSLHSKNRTTCMFWAVENSIEQCLAAHIVQCCQQYFQHCYT